MRPCLCRQAASVRANKLEPKERYDGMMTEVYEAEQVPAPIMEHLSVFRWLRGKGAFSVLGALFAGGGGKKIFKKNAEGSQPPMSLSARGANILLSLRKRTSANASKEMVMCVPESGGARRSWIVTGSSPLRLDDEQRRCGCFQFTPYIPTRTKKSSTSS